MSSRFSRAEFVGCRVRFQRLRDARLFNAWILEFSGSSLKVATSNENPVLPSETFAMEVTGPRACGRFNAVLVSIGTLPSSGSAKEPAIAEPANALLEFKVAGQVDYLVRKESSRRRLPDLPAQVHVSDTVIEGRVIDGASLGLGMITSQPLHQSEEIKLHIESAKGGIDMLARVKYCRPRKGSGYRCGLEILDMGRLDLPRWKGLLEAA